MEEYEGRGNEGGDWGNMKGRRGLGERWRWKKAFFWGGISNVFCEGILPRDEQF